MKSLKSHPYKGHIFILLSTFGFSAVPLLAKISLDKGMNAETVLTYRFLIAGTFFLFYALIKKVKLYIDIKTSIKLLLMGLLYAFESTCFFEAFKHISPSIGQLLFHVNPIMVAIGAFIVFRDRFTKNVVGALLLTAVGCGFLFWDSSAYLTGYGVILVLLAAFFYATFVIVGKGLLQNVEPMVVTTYTTVGCGLYLFTYSLFSGKLMPVQSVGIIEIIVILSLFSTIISILAFATGLKLLGATTASLISVLEPVLTVVMAYFILGETLTWIQVIGGLLIVASIVVIEMKFDKKVVKTEMESIL